MYAIYGGRVLAQFSTKYSPAQKTFGIVQSTNF